MKPGSRTGHIYGNGAEGPRRRAADQDMEAVLTLMASTRRLAFAGVALATAIAPIAGTVAWFLNASGYMPVTQREFQQVRAEQAAIDTEQTKSLARLVEQGILQRWMMLNARRIANGGLSIEDLFEYCALSATLKLQGVGCAG